MTKATAISKLLVDFNSIDGEGRVRASLRRADGPISIGQIVEAYDRDGNRCKASVVAINEQRGTARLETDASTWSEEDHEKYYNQPDQRR